MISYYELKQWCSYVRLPATINYYRLNVFSTLVLMYFLNSITSGCGIVANVPYGYHAYMFVCTEYHLKPAFEGH